MKVIQFSEMHVFPYSKRTGTPAARMEDQVDEEIKNERVHHLTDLSEQMQLVFDGPEDLHRKICRVQMIEAGVNECKGKLINVLNHDPELATR